MSKKLMKPGKHVKQTLAQFQSKHKYISAAAEATVLVGIFSGVANAVASRVFQVDLRATGVDVGKVPLQRATFQITASAIDQIKRFFGG